MRCSPPARALPSKTPFFPSYKNTRRLGASTLPPKSPSPYFAGPLLLSPRMESQRSQSEKQHPSATTNPAMTSCRKKKSEDATFLQDVRDHIDEFIHASMDEHKTCFTKTIQKMFGMSKVVAERNAGAKEVESSLPLQTTVSQ